MKSSSWGLTVFSRSLRAKPSDAETIRVLRNELVVAYARIKELVEDVETANSVAEVRRRALAPARADIQKYAQKLADTNDELERVRKGLVDQDGYLEAAEKASAYWRDVAFQLGYQLSDLQEAAKNPAPVIEPKAESETTAELTVVKPLWEKVKQP